MAASSEVKAGKAFVEIGTKDSALQKGLANAQKRLKSWGAGISSIGKRLAVIGGAITDPLAAAAKSAADSGAAIYDMSRRTGLSVEALSRLSYAADRSGTDIESVEMAIRRMQKTISGTKDEVEGTTGSLEHLGLAAADIKRKNPAEQFDMITGQIARIKDPTERASAAMKVFGRSGTVLLPLIEDLAELEERQKRLGLVKTTASAKEQKEFNVALQDAAAAAKSVWTVLGSAVIPVLKEKTAIVMRLTLTIRNWLKEHKPLISSLFTIALAVGAAGTGLMILGKSIALLAPVLGTVSSGIGLAGSALGMLMNPIGLVVVGLAGLAAYFLFATETGGKALDWLKGKFGEVKDEAVTAFGGIADALAAGDIRLSAQILWAFLRLEFEKGKSALLATWYAFKKGFLEVAYGAFYGAKAAWEILQNGLTVAFIETGAVLSSAWTNTTAFLSTLWTKFTSGVRTGWEATQNWLVDKLYELHGAMDETFDVNAAKAMNRQEHAQNQGAIDAETNAALSSIETKKQKDLAANEAQRSGSRAGEGKQHADNLAAIDTDFNDAMAALDKTSGAAKSAIQAEIDRLKRELADLRSQAAGKRAATKAEAELTAPDKPGFNFSDPNEALKEVAKRSGSVGTFNARATQGLETNDVAHQQLAESRKHSKYLKSLDDNFRANGPLQFGY